MTATRMRSSPPAVCGSRGPGGAKVADFSTFGCVGVPNARSNFWSTDTPWGEGRVGGGRGPVPGPGCRRQAFPRMAPAPLGPAASQPARRSRSRSSLRQHLVGSVAPGGRRAVTTSTQRRDRSGGAVSVAVLVLDDVVPPEEGGPARTEDDVGCPVGSGHRLTWSLASHSASMRRPTRSSWSRQVKMPKNRSSRSRGSDSTRGTQMDRTTSCSCTASASTCSV